MSLRQGLIGGWCPSLGPTAGTLLDRSAFRRHGTMTNMDPSTDWVGDVGGYALKFRGGAQYVGVSMQSPTAGDFAVSVWHKNLRTGAGDWDTIVSFGALPGFMLNAYSNQTTRRYTARRAGVADIVIGSTAYELNRWNHVVYSQRNGLGTIYLNGVADSSPTLTNGFVASNDPNFLTIGSYYQGQFSISVDGLIDDVILCNTAISESAILNLYSLGRGGIYRQQRRTRYASVRRFRRRQYAQLVGGGIV